MRRRIFTFVIALAVPFALAVPSSSAARAVIPYGAHPYGHTYPEWLRMLSQFYIGDASNPLVAGQIDGDCGEMLDGVFFMAAPIDVGVEFECHVPLGTPIILSHAGWFSTEGIDGTTDEELEAAAVAGFVTSVNELSIDGRAVRLRPIDTGAFDVISEPGSLYDSVIGVGTGPIRTAVRANLVVIHPLARGEHEITAAVTFPGDGVFSAVYQVRVG
jgi:hypothetical protein